MSKILEKYPHEQHIADNQVDTTKLSSTAQTALVDFNDLKAEAITAEAAGTLTDAQVSKLELYSKTIFNEVQDYLDEQAEEAAAAQAKLDAEAKAKADEEAKAKADAEAKAKADADAAAKAKENDVVLPWLGNF